MNSSNPKKPSGNPDVEQKESGTDQGRDNEDLGASATEGLLREERHSIGILGAELDGGGLRFEPKKPETPTDHPELADEPKRGIDPPTNPPKVDEPKNPASKPHGTTEDQIKNMEDEGPGPAEGRTDNKAGG